MKYLTLTALLAVLLFPLSGLGQSFNQDSIQAYIARYKDMAMEEQVRTGVPAAITLAQGICETGAGTSELCLNAHNHFGIKCKNNWQGATYNYDDDYPSECFRKYDNALQSYQDHSDFLKSNPRYRRLFNLNPTNYKQWAEGLKECGYATNKHYAHKLIAYIQDYDLEQYTAQALSSGQESPLLAYSGAGGGDGEIPGGAAFQGYSSSDTDSAPPVRYYFTTKKNGLKGFYAKKGDWLLEYAISHHIRYGKLLSLNDLPDQPLEADMFIYLEKKRTQGLQPYFKVAPGMDLLQVSQATGVDLAQLRLFNHLDKGEEPAAGAVLSLQKTATQKVPVAEEKDSQQAQSETATAPAGNRESEYIYLHHQTKSEKPDPPQEQATETGADVAATKQQDASPEKEQAAITPEPEAPESAHPSEELTAEPQKQEEHTAPAPSDNPGREATEAEENLTSAERLRAMMDKIVYEDGQEPSPEEAARDTTTHKEQSVPQKQEEQKANPTKKLRSYMEKLQEQRQEQGEDQPASYTTLPPGQQSTGDSKPAGAALSAKYYTVKRGDTAFSIAKKFGISLKQLKEWNHLPASMAVPLGARLQVAP